MEDLPQWEAKLKSWAPATNSGYCVSTVSGETFVVDNGWNDMAAGAVVVPTESWAAIKTFIQMYCRNSKNCNNAIGAWERME